MRRRAHGSLRSEGTSGSAEGAGLRDGRVRRGADRDPDGRVGLEGCRVGKAGDVETRRPGSGSAAVKTVSVR